ncbi:hypothetical protein, partial [Parvimonas micra]|uniref:hypothetical protein n=1 Tax=Parvimonas micra TaxID=33033 RepID=UPI002B49670F
CTHVTGDHAVYYNYGDYNGYRYQYFQIAYTIDENGNVTFTGEPEPVNVLTRIVPRDPSSGLSNNEGKTAMSGTSGTTEGQPASAAPLQVASFAELLAAAPAE